MSRNERILLIVLGTGSLLLRAAALLRYRFDSDEAQHLHVAWGWTAGLLQYRDVFDNHTPLFHILTAPLLAAFGERSDILLWMRGAVMLPIFAGVLVCTWVIARRVYDTRVAAWAVVILSLLPPFFLKSLEYRTDNLWTLLWMVALVLLVKRELTPLRGFAIGLVLGAALATSMKTTLLVATLAIAFAIVRRRVPVRTVLAAIAGFAIVPSIVALYFVRHDAWDSLVYCVFTFNSLVTSTRSTAWLQRAAFPVLLGIVYLLSRRGAGGPATQRLLAVIAGVYVATVAGLWVLITPRDFLALMPIAAILAAAQLKPRVLAMAGLLFAASLFYYADGFRDRTRHDVTMLDQLLRLTRAGEPVMDIKGETIFRPRPHYLIFEAITRAQMERGMLRDTIPEDVVRKLCYVAQADGPMLPPRGRAWLREHFLDLGRLRAAGARVGGDGTFTIAIPGQYVVLDVRGHAPGILDGRLFTGPRVLTAGTHRFERATPGEPTAVLWAPAFARGHSPFQLRDLEF